MDPKKMSDETLKRKIQQAEDILKRAEGEFVGALEAVSMLEGERDRRDLKKKASTPPKQIAELVEKWTAKAGDILRASEAVSADPRAKWNLLQQRDILLGCILDLEGAWGN